MLRLRAPTILLIVLGCAAGALAAASPWQDYRSFEGGFAVVFPGTPIVTRTPSPDGGDFHSFIVDLNETAYLVIYTSYRPGTFAGKDAAAILDATRDRLIGGHEGTLRVDRAFDFAGYQGRELVIDDAHDSTQVYRIYVVRDRLYQVICGGPKGFDAKPETERFQGSFQLLVR